MVNHVVDRNGNRLNERYSDAQSQRGFNVLRNRQERTHAQKQRQRQVLDKDVANEFCNVKFHNL